MVFSRGIALRGCTPSARMTRTVLLPHNTVLGELAREQRAILGQLPMALRCSAKPKDSVALHWHRVLPLCCFLPDTGEPPEVWETRITECRILPPVLRGNAVVYPVDIPGIPDLTITTAVPFRALTEPPQVRQFPGDFRVRTLRVFRLCSMTFSESDSGVVSRWTID
jgi:hypothetical protein